MKEYLKRMCNEHAELRIRIDKLQKVVYGEVSEIRDKINKVEYANMAIQLAAMKKYEEALGARLENAGIAVLGNDYFMKVGTIKEVKQEDKE